jgi:hypothetical protein
MLAHAAPVGRCFGSASDGYASPDMSTTLRRERVGVGSAGEPPDDDRTGTEETKEERLEREHEQLFHELRSIIPGAEVQFAFLLTVAFTQRFESLSDVQRTVYYATFLCSAASLILLLAPSSFHRVRFRQRDKEAMMRSANVEVLVALVLISCSIAGTVFLISDLMFSTGVAIVVSAVAWLAASSLWWGYPLLRRQHDDD